MSSSVGQWYLLPPPGLGGHASTVSKYEPIRDLLARSGQHTVTLSFERLADLVPGGLPASAYTHDAWWRDATAGTTHSQASLGWLAAGYRVVALDRKERRVTFGRI
jgi:hypothetical protein